MSQTAEGQEGNVSQTAGGQEGKGGSQTADGQEGKIATAEFKSPQQAKDSSTQITREGAS